MPYWLSAFLTHWAEVETMSWFMISQGSAQVLPGTKSESRYGMNFCGVAGMKRQPRQGVLVVSSSRLRAWCSTWARVGTPGWRRVSWCCGDMLRCRLTGTSSTSRYTASQPQTVSIYPLGC